MWRGRDLVEADMIWHFGVDKEVKIIKFRGDPSKFQGVCEVRGIVNKDATLSFGEFTQYDNDFGKLSTFLLKGKEYCLLICDGLV